MQVSNLVKQYASSHNFTIDYATSPQELIIVRNKHFNELYNYMKTLGKKLTVSDMFKGELKIICFE